MQPGSNKPGVTRPGLMVRLIPIGPWRIGPDSGARNHVDPVYHSDSLYGAVSAAMDRLGVFDQWLEATARRSAAAVAFSSCFPFVENLNLVIPPRTLWPPSSPALLASRVRWKSARFVPLSLIPLLVAHTPLADSEWCVDGASECLLPVGKPGPFRSGLRFHAAVDRLTRIGERHSVACLEFRPGAGLWTLVSFADEAARESWSDRVKAAFRLLADSGFGGERSQGWGHAAPPEFTEGWLPEMILPPREAVAPKPEPVAASIEPSMPESAPGEPTEAPLPSREGEGAVAGESPTEPAATGQPATEGEGAVAAESPSVAATESTEAPTSDQPATTEARSPGRDREGAVADESPSEPAAAGQPAEPTETPLPSRDREGAVGAESPTEPTATGQPATEPTETSLPSRDREGAVAAEPVVPDSSTQPDIGTGPAEAAVRQPPEIAPLLAPTPEPPAQPAAAHWLLSLFTPAPTDRVDWTRGNYALVARAGRVSDSGEIKKTAQMVAEGSVLYAASAPSGNALDVAPDGLAHPVFRAGFAVSVPLPEVG